MTIRLPAMLGCLVAATVLLTGCWDRLEIEDRATVVAIGLDPGSGGQGLHLSAEIAIPGKIPLGPGGGGGGGAGATNPRGTVFVTAGDGPTVAGALSSLQKTLNNELFLGHVRVIAINETLAREGLSNITDYLLRSPEIRRTAWLIVTPGPAADLINASPSLDRVPALFFTDMMEHYNNMGVLPPAFFGTYLVTSSAKGQDPIVPYVWAEGQGARLLGAAVFTNQRMVDILDVDQLQALENVIGPKKSRQNLTVPVPGSPGTQVRLQIRGRQTQLQPSMQGTTPAITVRIRLEGDIVEEVGGLVLQSPTQLHAITTTAQQMVQKDIQNLVARTQADHADVFGFGEQFRGKQTGFFQKQVGGKQAWDDTYYPQLKVNVQVRVLVRRIGTTAR